MGRPPLPIGTWGDIAVSDAKAGKCTALAHFRDYDGVTRRVTRTGKTKAAARSALLASLAERIRPESEDITPDTRLSAVAETYFAEGKWAINTERRYREIWDKHLADVVGNIRVREATVTRLDRTLKAITEGTGGPTAKLARTVLSGILGLAVRHGAAPANPLRDVAGITIKKKKVRALTLREIDDLRAHVRAFQERQTPDGSVRRGRPPSDDLLDIVDVLLGTGVRIGEVLALRWDEDVTFGEQTVVRITGTVVWEDGGPGMRRHLIRQEHPKTEATERGLVLPWFAADTLMRRRVMADGKNPTGLVFPSARGTLRDPGNVRKTWRRIREEAGLGWVTPHTFRKTVGTLLANEGGARKGMQQLGQASESVFEAHYADRTALIDNSALIGALVASGGGDRA